MPQKELRQLYDFVSRERGADNVMGFDEFSRNVQDSANARQVYDFLESKGRNLIEFEDFRNSLRIDFNELIDEELSRPIEDWETAVGKARKIRIEAITGAGIKPEEIKPQEFKPTVAEPATTAVIPKVSEEKIKKVVPSIIGQTGVLDWMSGLYEAVGGTASALDSWSKWLSEKTGLERGGLFKEISDSQKEWAEYFRERGIDEKASTLAAISKKIYTGLGQATMVVPMITTVGLPAYSAIHGGAAATEADESALIGTAKGYAEGLLLHGILKGLGIMRLPERAGTTGLVFGGLSLTEEMQKPPEQRDYEKVIADFGVGVGLGIGGAGKKTTKDIIKDFRETYGNKAMDKAIKEVELAVETKYEKEIKPEIKKEVPIEKKEVKPIEEKPTEVPVEKKIEKKLIGITEELEPYAKAWSEKKLTLSPSGKFWMLNKKRIPKSISDKFGDVSEWHKKVQEWKKTKKLTNFQNAKIEAQKKVDKIGEEWRPAPEGVPIERTDSMRDAIKEVASKYKVPYDVLRKQVLWETRGKEEPFRRKPLTKKEYEELKIKTFEEKPTEIKMEKEPPLVKPIEPVKFHSGLSAIMPEIVQKKLNAVEKLFKEPEGIAKQSWDIVKDYWGKREGLTFKHRDRWNRTLRQKVEVEGKKPIFKKQKFKDKFSKPELEDAIFYRQRTGNIWKGKEDTFKDVSKRLPEDLKWFMDGEVNEHINNMRNWYNKAPFTKDIVAREEVIKTYLTGVYSGNIKKGYEYIVGLKGRQFVTNNFMRNKKTYISFAEAFEKAGLIPKFRNIADQLDYQDAYMVKLYSNNELISRIHSLEKEIKQKLVVRTNSKLYDEAKLLKDSEGKNLYIKFEDPYLRSYRVGATKEGKPIWATSRAPALVHRDLAGAIQSVFSKDSYKPENIFWRNYDRAGSFLRYIRVTFSGFHFVPLAESLVGGKGQSVLNIFKWIPHGMKLLKDPIIMTEVKEARLRVKAPSEASRGQVEGRIKDLVNRLEAEGKGKKVIGKTIKYITAPQLRLTRFLFDEYLPLLKVKMYYDYKHRMLESAEYKNKILNEKQMKDLNRKVASTVNDQFGGQAWEMIRYLNDPKVMKWMHRAVGYPDWTISALRQAGAIGEGGIRGRLARRYWLRYGIAFLATQQAISYLNTGLYNDEKGDIKWSWDRAHSTFENIDPSLKHKIDFQLPDIKIKLPIVGEFNPGRELKKDGTYGRRYYSHFGKQMLEIPRYVIKPIDQLFAKSNPVIQMVFKQIAGGAPYEGGIFPARGGYTITGEYKAWKGKWGKEQLKERAIQLVKDATPFSIQSMWTTSPATAGMWPISKATSKFASQKIIEKAMRKGDGKKVAETVISLIDSNYEIESIERMITTISNALLKEGILEELKKIGK